VWNDVNLRMRKRGETPKQFKEEGAQGSMKNNEAIPHERKSPDPLSEKEHVNGGEFVRNPIPEEKGLAPRKKGL